MYLLTPSDDKYSLTVELYKHINIEDRSSEVRIKVQFFVLILFPNLRHRWIVRKEVLCTCLL